MAIILFAGTTESSLYGVIIDHVGFGSSLTSNIDYEDISISEQVGFQDFCYWEQDVYDRLQEVSKQYITDKVGFDDNYLLPLQELILKEWDVNYTWQEYEDTNKDIYYLFDTVSFQDVLSYLSELSDSELIPWDYNDTWTEDSWDSSNLVSLIKLITVFDTLGFQDLIGDSKLLYVFEDYEITIWDYTKTWEDDYTFVWESKSTAIEISIDDSFGFDDSIIHNINYNNLSITDIIGFDEDFPFIEVAVWLYDNFGLDDSSNYLSIITQNNFTEEFGFDDTLASIFVFLKINVDIVGFQEVVSSPLTYAIILLSDDAAFSDSIYSKDFIVTWRGRTKNYNMGYGGAPYGNIGYGDGNFTDIKNYRVDLYVDGVFKRTIYIPIQLDDSQSFYVYSWENNLVDNTTFHTDLTFDVYQEDNYGVLSNVQEVTYV